MLGIIEKLLEKIYQPEFKEGNSCPVCHQLVGAKSERWQRLQRKKDMPGIIGLSAGFVSLIMLLVTLPNEIWSYVLLGSIYLSFGYFGTKLYFRHLKKVNQQIIAEGLKDPITRI